MSKNKIFYAPLIGMGLAVLYFLTVTPSWASGRQQLRGHVPKDIAAALRVGDVEDSKPLHLAIGLPLRHQAGLKSLIQNLYDPHSSQYRRFLTPAQFTQLFGPTLEDYQKLRDFAESNGLSVVGTSSNRLLLDVTATAADVRRVFHVNLHYYQRTDGSQFYAPDSEPSVDLDLPISRVSGLDNATRPHSNLVLKGPVKDNSFQDSPELKTNPGTGTAAGGNYWGFDFRNVYVPCTSQTGTGQNIALFELDTYKTSNISNYETDTGIGSPSLTKVTVGSAINHPGSGEVEVELDIEMAMSMAPGARVCVYENKGDSDAELDDLLNAIANPTSPNPLCYEISSSWTWTGSFDSNVPPIFQQYAAQGQSYFQAAGDLGAYVTDDPQTTVPYPMGETALLTAVGGTVLTTSGSGGTLGTYLSETTWNDSPGPSKTKTPAPNAVSSGGICGSSTPVPIPTYQVAFVNGQNGGSASYRNIPDVVLIADNIEIFTEGSLASVGGTSAAAPLWAALTALINEQAASNSVGPVGLLNPTLYNLASNATTYANDFNDIADGSTNNYWGTDTNLYKSVTGYDLTTGLGSVRCNLIADVVGVLELDATTTPTNTATVTSTHTATNTPTNTGTVTPTHTPTVTATNTSTNSITNTATGTSTNTATNTTTNTGTVTSTNTPTDTATTTSTASATSTATETATNTSTNTATDTATVTLTDTPANTATTTSTASVTSTATETATNTSTNTATDTATVTLTNTPTDTGTDTATSTATSTATNTVTDTATVISTSTSTNTVTNSATDTMTNTATDTATNTVINTQTNTASNTATNTSTQTATNTMTLADTNTATNTATNSATDTITSTATNTATNTIINTQTNTATNTPTQTVTNTVISTQINTSTNTATRTPTITSTVTSTVSSTPTASGLLQSVVAEPNISENGEPIKFVINLGGNAAVQLSLFSLLSEGIFSETIQGNAGLNSITWCLKNQSRAPVASGLYVYVIEVNNGYETATHIGKIVVIH